MTRAAPPPPSRLDVLFDQAVARHGLIAPGDAVLVGVSGGPDSTALLHLLHARAARLRLRLAVGHLDHGLRPESAGDAAAVARMAAVLGLACHLERADVEALRRRTRMSVETAAREARFDFFRRTAERHGYTRVALGHHAGDNAETLLLNLLRGSGRRGLGGIRPLRDGLYVRPLLRAQRRDIEAFLAARNLAFLSDHTNLDASIRRNRIRHELIPLLERDYRPGALAALSRAAELLAEEDAWIDELTAPLLTGLLRATAPGRLELEAAGFDRLPPAAQRRILRGALQRVQGGLRRVGFEHLEAARAGACRLPGGLRVTRTGTAIVIEHSVAPARPGPAAPPPQWEYRLPACGTLRIPETGEVLRLAETPPTGAAGGDPFRVLLDADALAFPLTLRNRRPGDRFHPLGAPGSQTLKKFFIDHKVPDEERRRCPLLVSGDRIVWVAGHRVDERARVRPETRRVLAAERSIAPPRSRD
jgi:tRNA(Ile)-lysidine synthase